MVFLPGQQPVERTKGQGPGRRIVSSNLGACHTAPKDQHQGQLDHGMSLHPCHLHMTELRIVETRPCYRGPRVALSLGDTGGAPNPSAAAPPHPLSCRAAAEALPPGNPCDALGRWRRALHLCLGVMAADLREEMVGLVE
ncbi:hypothetical protein EJB05_56534, partial [Eragrostis curvula]